jgi:hypothetical protein
MKVAVMQPYFLPYLGYWQLLGAVDLFVLLDDVNFITRGYINRNRILLNNRAHLFSLPLEGASQNVLIKDVRLKFSERDREKFLKTIRMAYSRAKRFRFFFPLLEEIVLNDQTELARYIEYSLRAISGYIGLETKFIFSSHLTKDTSLKGQERILEICRVVGAKVYFNLPGGKSLYDQLSFTRNKLILKFIQPKLSNYQQYGLNFVPNLSIIDALMFNEPERIKSMLKEFSLHDQE